MTILLQMLHHYPKTHETKRQPHECLAVIVTQIFTTKSLNLTRALVQGHTVFARF